MELDICPLFSGSSGNSTYLSCGEAKILIDAGVTCKRIIEALGMLDVRANELSGVVITHEHIDHIKGIGVLSRKYDIPIYANELTWEAMIGIVGPIADKNMRALKMLTPSSGIEGVKAFIIDTVKTAGANPCPPIVLGVGIGGTMEKAALIAKRQLLREIGSKNPDPYLAELEAELLSKINDLGIGPGGLGGDTTALAVFIDTYPTHIAGLPVAVNMQCHAARHKTVVL